MIDRLLIRPFSAWFIGPSNPLNAQVGGLVAEALRDLGVGCVFVGEERCRSELWPELSGRDKAELESALRAAKLCRLLFEAGISSMVASRAPSAAIRRDIRRDLGECVEIYCRVDQSESSEGTSENSGGLPFEEPAEPELTIDASGRSIRESAQMALTWLNDMGYLSPAEQSAEQPDDQSTVLKRLEELGYI